jgi:hypothetical protein
MRRDYRDKNKADGIAIFVGVGSRDAGDCDCGIGGRAHRGTAGHGLRHLRTDRAFFRKQF